MTDSLNLSDIKKCILKAVKSVPGIAGLYVPAHNQSISNQSSLLHKQLLNDIKLLDNPESLVISINIVAKFRLELDMN